MKVIKNELIAFFDVDDTIIKHDHSHINGPGKITCSLYGENRYVTPHELHIKLLKDYKARGYTIYLWSGNGFFWCQEVAHKLELTSYIDYCLSKPVKVVDNEPYSNWLPNPICLEDK
jgi:phosphoserine phosphatase